MHFPLSGFTIPAAKSHLEGELVGGFLLSSWCFSEFFKYSTMIT